eukprot:s2722_g1.t1
MKSPDEQGEAHERISRILEIVKGEKMPSTKQTGKKQEKHRKTAANSERRKAVGAHHQNRDSCDSRDGGREGRKGDGENGEADVRSPTKVWMRKSEVPPATALNAAAPEFTPSFQTFPLPSSGTESDYGCGVSGYCESYDWTVTPTAWEMGPALPEVVPGTREGEYLGLQCIAEMGEWIVFRERKDNAKPFFWNMYTEEKSWDAPAILQELGVAEVLQKWSQDLDAFGIEPSPALRNPRARNRKGERNRELRDPKTKSKPMPSGHDAPPGFV